MSTSSEGTIVESTTVGARQFPLKRRRVITMIILFIVTLGAYYGVWFLRRRAALNALDSPRKLGVWPSIAYLTYCAAAFVYAIATAEEVPAPNDGAEIFLQLAQLGTGLWMLLQNFYVRDILQDHLAGPGEQVPRLALLSTHPAQLSGLMTFFFQIFYLQYVINRTIAADSPGAARVSPAMS